MLMTGTLPKFSSLRKSDTSDWMLEMETFGVSRCYLQGLVDGFNTGTKFKTLLLNRHTAPYYHKIDSDHLSQQLLCMQCSNLGSFAFTGARCLCYSTDCCLRYIQALYCCD